MYNTTRVSALEQLLYLVRQAISAHGGDAWDAARSVGADPFTEIEHHLQRELGGVKRQRRGWHYAIIGAHSGEQIGCCWGEEGKRYAREDGEPNATFVRQPQRLCKGCGY